MRFLSRLDQPEMLLVMRIATKIIACRSITKVAAAIAASLPASMLYAQSAPNAAAGDVIQLEELVVTARKIEEDLQTVPLSVNVLRADAIEQLQMQSPEDFARYIPGLSFTQGFGRNSAERPVIRGQSNILGDSNASFFIDGVYLNGPATSTEIANLERIEVLKGPQAALYGRATFSGAVNYITRAPKDEFEAKVSLSGAEHEQYEANAFLSGPLAGDAWFFSISARHYEYGGEYRNQLTGDYVGSEQTDGATFKLAYRPNESFEANWLLTYAEDDDGHPVLALQGREFNNCLPRSAANPRSRGYYCGELLGADDLTANLQTALFPNGGGLTRERLRNTLTLQYQFANGWTVNSATHYSDEDQATEIDVSYAGYDALVIFDNPMNPQPPQFANTGSFWRLEAEDREDFSQELRVRSPDEQALRWMLGAYYFDGSDDRTRFDKVLPSGQVLINARGDLREKQIQNRAVFTSLGYTFNDAFTATAELRYAEDELEQINYASFTVGTYSQDGPVQRETFNSVSPRVTLRYTPSDDATYYINFARGNKPGTFNSGVVLGAAGVPASVEEEESRNYEIGAKLSFLDGRITFSSAAYFIDWFNQQLTQTVFSVNPTTGAIVTNSFIDNVGETEVWGAELELSARLTDHWNLQVGYAYIHPEITSYINQDQADLLSPRPTTFFAPPNCDTPTTPTCVALRAQDLAEFGSVAGNLVPRAPEHQAFLISRYSAPLTDSWDWFVTGDVTYEGSKFVQVDNLAKIGARTLLGLRAGVRSENWSVTAWAKNLGDDDTVIDSLRYIDTRVLPPNISTVSPFILPRGFVLTLPRQRQVGLSATYEF